MNKFCNEDFKKLLILMNDFFGMEGIEAIINIMSNNKDSNDIAMTMQNLFTQSKIYELKPGSSFLRPVIYFLFYDGKIQYIGQSISLVSRIRTHRFDGRKTFDKVFYMNCEECDLDEIEERLIKHYNPPLNRTPYAKGGDRKKKGRTKPVHLDLNHVDDLINKIISN